MSIMKAGAYLGYNGVAHNSLIIMAENEKIVLPAVRTRFSVMKAILDHYLAGELSAEEIIDILERSMWTDDKDPVLHDLLSPPEIRDTFGEDEVKILETWKVYFGTRVVDKGLMVDISFRQKRENGQTY